MATGPSGTACSGEAARAAGGLRNAVTDRFDFVVIGAGGGGEAAAHYARRRGATVAIIDRDLFGGSCPFWACMPSKTLLHAAEVRAHGGDYPWTAASDRRDYMILRERRDYPDDTGQSVRSMAPARPSSVGRPASPVPGPSPSRTTARDTSGRRTRSSVVDRAGRVLVGAFIAGPGAGEAIHESVLALKLGTPIDTLAEVIHAFPTVARVMGGLFAKVVLDLR